VVTDWQQTSPLAVLHIELDEHAVGHLVAGVQIGVLYTVQHFSVFPVQSESEPQTCTPVVAGAQMVVLSWSVARTQACGGVADVSQSLSLRQYFGQLVAFAQTLPPARKSQHASPCEVSQSLSLPHSLLQLGSQMPGPFGPPPPEEPKPPSPPLLLLLEQPPNVARAMLPRSNTTIQTAWTFIRNPSLSKPLSL
jgi:hypothetical protein